MYYLTRLGGLQQCDQLGDVIREGLCSGVTSPQRSPLSGDMPTLREANVQGADLEIWTAIAAPAAMPPAAVTRLNEALADVTRLPEVQQALLTAGWQAQPGTPKALSHRMRQDTSLLGGVILMRGIKIEA